jgi:penicillin amidase
MAFSLSLNLNKELERFHLLVDRKLDSTRVARLMPEYDSSRFPTALSDQDLHHLGSNSVHDRTVSEAAHLLESERIREFTAANAAAERVDTHVASSLRSALDKLKRTMGPSRASNDWVVHGNLTSTGKPIMCNDPHLQLTAPSVWILFHLQVPQKLNVIGSSFAGIPGVVLGRNDHISWAVTNVGADVQDLYMMQEQPGNSSFYLHRGQYVPYTIREEIIKVSGKSDVVLRVRSSIYGPVVTDIDEDYLKRETKTPLSLRWVALDANVTAVEGFYRMSLAHNYSEFREAVRFFRTPSQNLVYADVQGNIAYQMNGVIPIRAPNHSGLYPVPGNGDFDWQGFIPYDELPRTFNPPEGFIATANNRITPDSYAHFIASDWDAGSSGYRALRITQEIRRIANTSSRVTPRSMQALQNDRVSLDVFDWMVLLQRISPASLSQDAASWRSKLLAWDGNTLPGSLETSVYVGWLRELSRLPAAEVGTSLWLDQTYLQNVLIRHQSDPNCDSNSTAPDSCLAFASRAFETAVAAHSDQEWSRDVHPLVLAHPVLNNTPIECLVNRRVAHGGTDETINVGSITFGTKDWVQQHGPSYRAMYDLSAPEASQFVLPGGESGSIFSPFYDNMLKNWLHGRYEKMQTRDFKTRFELRLSP